MMKTSADPERGPDDGRAQRGGIGVERDLVDAIIGLADRDPVRTVRMLREKVVEATQGSYRALFEPRLFDSDPTGPTLAERYLVAFHACHCTPSLELADRYRAEATEAGAQVRLVNAAADGHREDLLAAGASERFVQMLAFTRTLVERPVEGDRAALQRLVKAGLSTPAIVALAQLVAFVSYQTRVVAGLEAMRHAAQALAPALPSEPDADDENMCSITRRTKAAAPRPSFTDEAPAGLIEENGFTNATLAWRAWLETVDLDAASAEQVAVLEESHPQAKTSDYYRTLVHQPRILRERSAAFNTIMYAPGGLPRAERELAATVVSRINGCVYCASVHAQRFEQLAKRSDSIAEIFDDPSTAGTTRRERSLTRFAIDLTTRPHSMAAHHIDALRAAGLGDLETLDLIHSVAIFAWANRLMLNLGEPVFPDGSGSRSNAR